MKHFIFILLLLSSSPLLAKKSKVEYPLVYLTWFDDPTSTMSVNWVVPKKKAKSNLSYRELKKKSAKDVEGQIRPLPQNEPFVICRVNLSGLKPDTTYSFQVAGSKKEYRFKTMPKTLSRPVRFAVGGDCYSNKLERFQKMCKVVGKQNPDVAILGGDIAYSAPKKKGRDDLYAWQKFFTVWDKEMVTKDGCLVPMLCAIGNHEVIGRFKCSPEDAPFFYAFFDRGYFDVSFGNWLHFIFLDSQHTHKIKGNQTFWLNRSLQTHASYPHKMAVMHVGPYPSTGPYKLKIRKKIRTHWVPLFEKYRLDVCFENHDHGYKRTFPLKNGSFHPEGVLYIGDGTWGVNPRKTEDHPYLEKRASEQQVTICDLTKEKRTFYAINVEGKIIDRHEQFVKMDQR